jgi:DNA-nicking Smr family endonuclease
MKEVEPLSDSYRKRINEQAKRVVNSENANALRQAAENFTETQSSYALELRPMSADEFLSFKRKTCSHRAYQVLEQGRQVIQARLDLHELRVHQADVALTRFLDECANKRFKYLLVIHGKGTGRLKALTQKRLIDTPCVQAFCSAIKADGGQGATYVLLSF